MNRQADAEFVRDVTYSPECMFASLIPHSQTLIVLDKPEETEGAPCHVQIIGRRLKDEALLQHAKVIEQVLREGK